jgi:hypothetical protein
MYHGWFLFQQPASRRIRTGGMEYRGDKCRSAHVQHSRAMPMFGVRDCCYGNLRRAQSQCRAHFCNTQSARQGMTTARESSFAASLSGLYGRRDCLSGEPYRLWP